jgi:Putative porin
LKVAKCPIFATWFPVSTSLFFLLTPLATLLAQIPEAATSTVQIAAEPIDTSPLYFVLPMAPETAVPQPDTLPDQDFRMYDPARKAVLDWGHLGNLGSSARPLWYETNARIGFETGFRPFQLYRSSADELRFYRHGRTFSEAFFTRGRTQRDAASRVRASHTFEGGLNFSLEYRGMDNIGQFLRQRTKHNTLLAGVWHPIGSRYEYFLVFASNANRQIDNGGIIAGFTFGNEGFNGPLGAMTRLKTEDSKTVTTDRSLKFTQYFRFGNTQQKRAFRAVHSAQYGTERWKFSDPFDETEAAGTDFYGLLRRDRRGNRQVVTVRRLENTFNLNTYRSKARGTTTDGFSAGLRHSIFWVNEDDVRDSVVNNLFLTGQFTLTPSKRFYLLANGDLGLLWNAGQYRVTGLVGIDFGKAGRLEGSVLSQIRPPDWVAFRMLNVRQKVWENNGFNKVIENSIQARYSLPLIGFSATGQQHLINNYVYFDQTAFPIQLTSPLSVTQLLLQQNFHVGPIYSDNTVGLQQVNNTNVLRLPNWFTKNSLYVKTPVFKKKLLLYVGADFRMHSQFTPDDYMPLTGQFFLQDSLVQQPYPWIDGFVALKIQSFRFFFRYENLNSLWNPNQVYFQTSRHPQAFASFRLGITWRFMDNNLVGNEQQGPTGGGSSGPPPGIGRRGGF